MTTKADLAASLAPSGEARESLLHRLLRPQGLRQVAELGILVGLFVVFSALNPRSFPTVANINNILNQAAIPMLIGVGATFVVLMGSTDLSVEGVAGAAGMAFVLLSANSRNAIDLGPAAFVVAVALGAGLGMITGLIHTRLRVPSFIVSLGMWYVGLGIAAVLFGQEMIPFLQNQAAVAWPTATPLGLPNSFLLALVIVAGGFLVERFTRLGRFPYAIGNNEAIAVTTGIPVARYRLYVFTLAGACSGLAGVMGSLSLGAGAANVSVGNLFFTLAAVVIGGTPLSGGKGGVLRTLLGVLILATLYNGLILSGVDPNVQSGVSGLVIVCAVIAAGWSSRGNLRVVK